MPFSRLLEPDLFLGGSILNLTRETLEKYELQGLVLDVDETLVPLKENRVSQDIQQWVANIKQIATLSLVSNNLIESRIAAIAESLDLPYISGAAKPSRRKLNQAVQAMQLPVERIGMVGDRLLTDVLAGNRLGMFTILVEPMVDPNQGSGIYRLRSFEVWLSQILGASLH
ncbi:MAG: YqeG family HAD IIIA-type phosphatase [Oscillatoria sp. SIO1A7]|nr:YqeG family HAD IIIA-type phosphatase [Oscillatoria sp. SIO1A7]